MEGLTLIGSSTTVCHKENWSNALPKCKGNFIYYLFYLFIYLFIAHEIVMFM